MTDTILLIGVFISICSEAFFSGSELGIISYNRIRIKNEAYKNKRWARIVYSFIQTPGKLFATTLFGTNLSGIAASTLFSIFIIRKFGLQYEYLTFVIISPLILLFGEILPKSYVRKNASRLLPYISFPLWAFSIIFKPVTIIFSRIASVMLTIFHAQNYQNRFLLTKEELALIIRKDASKSDVKKSERKMIERILNFTETKAIDVMIPLVDVRALSSIATIDNAIHELKESGFSRYPIYSERVDNIIGILNIHELLFATSEEQSIKKYINKINYVPESHPIDILLVKMQRDGTSMYAVVDEYGGCVGIITREDILEEVVGNIEDEYDIEEPLIEIVNAETFIINARASVEELNDKHGFKIPEGDYETLGGFILHYLKKIPAKGDSFHYRDLKITIKEASSKAIEEIEIVKG